ncbi:flagellar protein FlaG [Paenibacillus caui]|uniref:flagellar protein FlaG n=1 Tax=Paenibacillus caui TaxID=2873927 RepID=UPI001CA9960B|nr:flagellar protein FlaG [Paenibacillus caui]
MNIRRVETVSVETVKSFSGSAPGLPLQPIAGNSGIEKTEGQYNYHSLTDEEKTRLDKQIEKLNKAIADSNRELHFKYNDKAKQLYVEVVNAKTKEVVNSLPPEFLIDLSIKMKELIGMFIDQKI